MTNKIILNNGSCLSDLLIFENSVNENDIKKIIEKVQNTIADYTNEDIYMAINEKYEIKQQIDLLSINELYY